VLDLEALARAELRDDPYDWARVHDAISPEDAARLVETFPTDRFWTIAGDDGEKSYTYDARPLVTLGSGRPAPVGRLAPEWEQVADDLLSLDYRKALGTLIGQSLDGALMEASVWRWGRAAQLGPHLDLPAKVVTQVFYFNDPRWEPAWGGCLRILRSRDREDTLYEIPPVLGSASVLVRSDRSWHSVTPVRSEAPEGRRSLIITWFHPGSTSPVWAVDEAGGVSCPVGRPASPLPA
jgi:SM-20-related protein